MGIHNTMESLVPPFLEDFSPTIVASPLRFDVLLVSSIYGPKDLVLFLNRCTSTKNHSFSRAQPRVSIQGRDWTCQPDVN
jgi:hypothetical protein